METKKYTINTYIVASCKKWNRNGFDSLPKGKTVNWIWVENPEGLLNALRFNNPRYIFFLHWNWRVPSDIWEKFECVCFHMTDVPYGRGGSPLQNLILAGHSKTKLTALRMVEEMDAGPVYVKRPLALNGTAKEIYIRAGQISFDIIQYIVEEEPQPKPQTGDPIFFKRRKPWQSQLPEKIGLEKVYDFIRMLDADGYPQAFLDYGNFKLEFQNAKLGDE